MSSSSRDDGPPIEAFRELLHQGRFGEALTAMNAVLPAHSKNLPLNKLMGVAHLLSGDAPASVPFFQACVDLGPANAEAHFDLGVALEAAERLEQAAESFERATGLDADYADAHNNLGLLQDKLGQIAGAVRHLERAVELMPGSPVFHSNLATILKQAGELDQATEHFETAIRLDPAFVQAYGNYGDLLQFRNRLEDVAALLDRARAHCDLEDPGLLDLRAHLAMDEKRFEDAGRFLEKALESDTTDVLKHRRLSLLGKVNDRLGAYPDAFRNFETANRYAAETGKRQGISGESYARHVDALISHLEDEADTGRPEIMTDDSARTPVFLVGFPRSGTTLLDTILRSHPDIEVLEEQPLISELRLSQKFSDPSFPVPAFSPNERQQLQTSYYASVERKFGSVDAPVLVDKFPLNLVEAGFIHSVFPNAKFILAIRHPNDCVLSCFMQTFDLNPAMANFLDFGDAARLYDRAMTLWHLYAERLDLQAHTILYEDVVADLRAAVEPLLEYLGLGWHDDVENYRATALARGHINTPSYNQVTQAVYRHAMGRWTHYEEQLRPYLPLLQPWEKRWGYT